MTPKRLLGLWRERWGKADEHLPDRPYARGSVHLWTYRLPFSPVWAVPGTGLAIVLLGVAFLFFVVQLDLTLNGQITLGLAIVGLATAVRRFEGPLFALTVICLGLLCSGQYFHWRFAHTLVLRSTPDLLLSMALCTVELCWVVHVYLHTVNRLWPRAAEEIPAARSELASCTVDIVAPVDGLDEPQALAFLRQCLAIDWPSERRRLVIVDAFAREGIARFARESGALLPAAPDVSSDVPDQTGMPEADRRNPGRRALALEAALLACRGDFVLVTDARHAPAPDLLNRVLGWFSPRTGLSLLYTRDHALDPAGPIPSASAARPGHADAQSPDFALLRRADWLDARARHQAAARRRRSAQPRDENEQLRELVSGLRDRSALVSPAGLQPTTGRDAAEMPAGRLHRIDRADSGTVQRLKAALAGLEAMLHFYRPIAFACLFAAPVLALLGGYPLARARGDWIAPMTLPHLAMLAIIHERSCTERRWGLFRAVREAYLSLHLPVLTAASFLTESMRNPALFLRRSLGTPLDARTARASAWSGLLIALNLAAMIAGLAALLMPGPARTPGSVGPLSILIGLAFVNAALLLARQSALHEGAHVRSFLLQRQRLPATLVFASGRTLTCSTVNFPGPELVLALPRALERRPLEPMVLQIHHDRSPINLTVHATRVEGENLFIKTDSSSQAQFASLQQAVLSRNAQWPAWFPKKDADRLLPPFVNDWLVKLVDASTRLGNLLKVSELLKLFGR